MYDRRVVALRPSRAKSAIDVFRKGNSSGVKAERSTASLPRAVLDVQTRDGQVSAARASRCKQGEAAREVGDMWPPLRSRALETLSRDEPSPSRAAARAPPAAGGSGRADVCRTGRRVRRVT